MKNLIKASVVLFISCTACFAVPMNKLDVGDGYYINNVFRENDYVRVIRIDRSDNTVKIRYTDGNVKWVKPQSLMTKHEAFQADVGEGIVVVGGILALFDALLSD